MADKMAMRSITNAEVTPIMSCGSVLEPDEDLTSSATAKVTHFRRATSVRFQTDMFECIVDHEDAEETTPYNFLPAQVAAYIKPPAFRPADVGKKTENLAYVHADIRRPPEPIGSAQLTQEQEEEEDWAASIGPGSEEEVKEVMRRELQALCQENHQDSDDDMRLQRRRQ